MDSNTPQAAPLKAQISKELRAKANEFLNSREKTSNLVELIEHLEKSLKLNQPVTPVILTLEVVFVELFKRREIFPLEHVKRFNKERENHSEWLKERYFETIELLQRTMLSDKIADASQAMTTIMKLLVAEHGSAMKAPLDKQLFSWYRLKDILTAMLSTEKSQTALINRFKEYAEYLDVVYSAWECMLPLLTDKGLKSETFVLNCLELINVLNVSKTLQDEQKLLCVFTKKSTIKRSYEYAELRKIINATWQRLWKDNEVSTTTVHRQILIVLLERVMNHLDKPIQLTDYFMDSLDCGGPISLLALQGIFTLIQKHNITYPNIYEKLYSMFEPAIFHTKYKARLFYLADIFLSSTHLPENLVGAFVKRLARLSLAAPPQDIIIILNFIGNIILRHPGLRRLISAPTPTEVSCDPFLMDEPEPTKAKALESSLWEVVALQKHAIPEVAIAAKFINQPLPKVEWDLSTILEQKENDIFEKELGQKKQKLSALAFERPDGLALQKNDKVVKYWALF